MQLNKKRILITTTHPAPYMDELFDHISEEYHVEVIYIDATSHEKTWKNFHKSFPGHLRRDISILKHVKLVRRADLIIVGGWASFFHIKTIALGLIMGTKVALFSDAPNLDNKLRSVRMLQSLILRIIPLYFVTGSEAGKVFRKTYWVNRNEKIKDFPYQSWQPSEIEKKDNKEKRKLTLSREGSRMRVFVANRFIDRKGYSYIVEALRYLKDAGFLDFFRFDIAGDGPLLNKYKEILGGDFPQVVFNGWVETNEYRRLMLECDVFVHVSKFEPYGIPVIDACNCEKMVIASVGVCAAVDAKNAGYPVQILDPEHGLELGSMLKNVYENRHCLYDLTTSEKVKTAFAPYRNLATIKEVLESLSK